MAEKPSVHLKQRKFIHEYLKDRNATKAATRAGYSAKTAASQGVRLLKNAKIRNQIDELIESEEQASLVTRDRIIGELHRIATVDTLLAFKDDGVTLKPLSEWPKDLRRAVSGIEVVEYYETKENADGKPVKHQVGWIKKVRFWEKNKANELLGRHLRLFVDTIGDSGKTLEDLLVASYLEGEKKKAKDGSK